MGFQAVTDVVDIKGRVTEEHGQHRRDLQRCDARRNAGADGDEDEQRVEGVLQRTAKMNARNDARKSEGQGQDVLYEQDDGGNDTRKDQRGLVQGVVMGAGPVDALVHPGNR